MNPKRVDVKVAYLGFLIALLILFLSVAMTRDAGCGYVDSGVSNTCARGFYLSNKDLI